MPFSIDLADIVELGSQIATAGASRIAEAAGDDVFEHVVAVAMLVYQNSVI